MCECVIETLAIMYTVRSCNNVTAQAFVRLAEEIIICLLMADFMTVISMMGVSLMGVLMMVVLMMGVLMMGY